MEQCLLGQTYDCHDDKCYRQGFTLMQGIREFLITRHPENAKSISEIKGTIKNLNIINGCRFAMAVLGATLRLDIVLHARRAVIKVKWQSYYLAKPLFRTSSNLAEIRADLQGVLVQMDYYIIKYIQNQKNKLYLLKACEVHNIDEHLRRHVIQIGDIDDKPTETLGQVLLSFSPW